MFELPPPPPQLDPDSWVSVLDATEQAFTIQLPRGWQNRAWLRRNGQLPVQLATSVSPSGATALFSGDPSFPMFSEPNMFGGMPGAVTRPYTSIEHILPSYIQQRFGGLPGFRVTGMSPLPDLMHLVGQKAQRSGAQQLWVTAGRIAFTFSEGGHPVHAIVIGSSTNLGGVWFVDVHGVSTTEDPEPFVATLLTALDSRQTTPAMQARQMQERAASAAQHQATMAGIEQNGRILAANHAQNMANIQSSAASHQAHMGALHAAHDAHNASWTASQASQDAAHHQTMASDDLGQRRFLNMIAEERTVVDPNGDVHQVAAGFDRYFRRRSDGVVIGTHGHEAPRDPTAFDELRIKV
jgi:hypothetical protein